MAIHSSITVEPAFEADEGPIDIVSALLTQAMLAPFFSQGPSAAPAVAVTPAPTNRPAPAAARLLETA